MKTKKTSTIEKIQMASIKLFNTQDTLSVTTNHIAKEAGISPGNLYYHFKNKEAIVLNLYKQLSKTYEKNKSLELLHISDNPIRQLHQNFDLLSELFYNYRFLLRDINVLIALYPSLKELFIQNQAKRIEQIEHILNFFVQQNILEKEIMPNIKKRAKLHWFVTTYWQSFASTTGEVSHDSIQEAKEIFFEFMIYPYLTTKGQQLLNQI